MKKDTIIKIIISAAIFITIICLEIFGLSFVKNYEILFCNSNQSMDAKDELSNLTGALPSKSTYSIKMITRNGDVIDIYYMYDGKISNYETSSSDLPVGSFINQYMYTNGINGENIYYGIIIFTALLLGILIAYLFISKNPIKVFLKICYFILSLLILIFVLCIVPMLSKNHGGAIYYYTVIIGTYFIGFLYGYKNKAFFIPTIFMIPICLVAKWFNYRHALLVLENICAYIFLNFIGALTGRILEKNKGMKRKHFIFYGITTILLLLGTRAIKIKARTATSMISDCCEIALLGILFSVIIYFIYIIIKKTKEVREKNQDKEIINQDIENNKKLKKNTKIIIRQKIELIIVIILIIGLCIAIYYSLKSNSYIETNLQSYSETLDEKYGYRIVGQKIYITCNYGKDWSEVPGEFQNTYATSKEFADDSYYMDSNKIIFETYNGDYFIGLTYSDDDGSTWQNSAITDIGGYIVYLRFFDKENGVAMICYGTELGQREHIRASITHDGGKTWITQKGDNSSVRINRGAEIEFTSITEGKIENTSYDGSKTVYVTEDAGITWTVK